MVLNIDEHDEPGSHWVAFYIDNEKRTLEYFDSVGDEPNRNIRRFIKKVRKFCEEKNGHYSYKYNKIRHQKKNTECGMFCIYYIVSRLGGKTFEKITGEKITDEHMNKMRLKIFRPRV